MKALTKQQSSEKAAHVAALSAAAENLEKAVAEFNAVVEAAQEPVTAAVEEYNAALQEAANFVEAMASEIEAEIADKSERWQESEKGQAFDTWQQEWEAVVFDDIQIDFPDQLEGPDLSAANALEDLPEEP